VAPRGAWRRRRRSSAAARRSPDGRARLRTGIAAGTAVVQRSYLDHVYDGFRRLGEAEHDHFLSTTDLDGLPFVDLERVDLPPVEPRR